MESAIPLPHLETFSKAAESNSFTAAAQALGLTQAAVSQRIQALEKSLGESLFQRRGGRVLLTEAGQKLYAYAQRILDLHREARREITGWDAPLAGELLLAASSIPGEHLLPALLADFGRCYPHVRVRAEVSDSMAVVGQVERGEVHLGLAGRKVEKKHLEYRFLSHDRMVVVGVRRGSDKQFPNLILTQTIQKNAANQAAPLAWRGVSVHGSRVTSIQRNIESRTGRVCASP